MTEALIQQRLELGLDRVRNHSAHHVNRRVVREMNARVEQCIRQGRDAVIRRLGELDHEWDIDRVLMANFAVIGGLAYAVGLDRYSRPRWFGLRRRRTGWLRFFGVQLGFLLLHATAGWCPPVVVWRRLGVRTKTEIEVERSLLLAALGPGEAPVARVAENGGGLPNAPRGSQVPS
jgi:hypothetical protein